jgi:modulator of FtsH protease
VDAWHEFYVATVGAGAALVGLIIVAMTVTIKDIIASASLPSRAFGTIASLGFLIVVSGLALFPEINEVAYGWTLFVGSLLTAIPQLRYLTVMGKDSYHRTALQKGTQVVLSLGQFAPTLVGSILLVAGAESGLYWAAAGVLGIFLASIGNAWVLLVEIQR